MLTIPSKKRRQNYPPQVSTPTPTPTKSSTTTQSPISTQSSTPTKQLDLLPLTLPLALPVRDPKILPINLNKPLITAKHPSKQSNKPALEIR